MKRINVLLVGLGLVLAISSGGLAMVYLQSVGQPQTAARPTTTRVLVAVKDVPEFGVITADRVELRDLAMPRAPEGALTVAEEAIGRMALARIRAGEIVVGAKLGEAGLTSAAAALPPESPNEPQRVLYAIPATDLLAQSGAVGRGDRVDVLASAGRGQVTHVVLRNIAVLGVGRWSATGEAKEQLTTTPVVYLVVTPQDALVLKHLRDISASLDLVLRAPRDDRDTPTDPVDNEYLSSQFGLGPP